MEWEKWGLNYGKIDSEFRGSASFGIINLLNIFKSQVQTSKIAF